MQRFTPALPTGAGIERPDLAVGCGVVDRPLEHCRSRSRAGVHADQLVRVPHPRLPHGLSGVAFETDHELRESGLVLRVGQVADDGKAGVALTQLAGPQNRRPPHWPGVRQRLPLRDAVLPRPPQTRPIGSWRNPHETADPQNDQPHQEATVRKRSTGRHGRFPKDKTAGIYAAGFVLRGEISAFHQIAANTRLPAF